MDLCSNLKLSLADDKFVKLLNQIEKDNPYKVLDIPTKEQICFRMYICKGCYENMRCKECGCNPTDTFIEKYSCNDGKDFPNLMNKWKWEDYKRINNIEFI